MHRYIGRFNFFYPLSIVALLSTCGLAQGTFELEGVPFTHHAAEVNGVRLHYVQGGQGSPVLLVHGWPQTWFEWHEVMPELAEQHTVIAVDLRGAGNSGKPLTGYDKRTLAADLHALVQILDLAPVHYVGHDIGGMVGYAFASSHPDATRTFTILDVPLPGVEPLWSQILADPRSWHFSFHAVQDLPESLVEGQEREYIEFFMAEQTSNIAAIPDEDIDLYAAAYAAPGAMRAGFEYYRAFPQDVEDNQAFAQTPLAMPVLALGGEFSAGPFMVDLMRGVASDVRGGVITGSGHWLTEEQPDVLAKRLLEFFNRSGQ